MTQGARIAGLLALDVLAVLVFALFTFSMLDTVAALPFALLGAYFVVRGVKNLTRWRERHTAV